MANLMAPGECVAKSMMLCSLAVVVTTSLTCAACTDTKMVVEPLADFQEQRATHRTELVRAVPSPQAHERIDVAGFQEFRYGSRRLKGWWALPETDKLKSEHGFPAVVLLHSGFALDPADLTNCRGFLDAGFAVVAPSFRGENGNPGNFELLYGELEDARAALAWAERQSELDRERLLVFGHSVGGALSGLLALFSTPRLLATGSADGVFDAEVFDSFAVPFKDSPKERALRLFALHVLQLQQPHFACASSPYVLSVAGEAESAVQGRKVAFVLRQTADGAAGYAECLDAFLSDARDRMQAATTNSLPPTAGSARR